LEIKTNEGKRKLKKVSQTFEMNIRSFKRYYFENQSFLIIFVA